VAGASSSGSGMAMVITKTYSNELALQPITLNDQVIDEGVSVKFWMKCDKTLTELSLKYNKFVVRTGLTATSTSFDKIAQVGEWTLYEAIITFFGSNITSVATTVTPSIYFAYSGISTFVSEPSLYVDDVRMQPLDANVSTYVYDPATLKIIASFDDQHFPLLYQYNAEGKLIRKLKETTEGVKTVTETQYNIPQTTTRPY
jgi:YD repeat-containing protein